MTGDPHRTSRHDLPAIVRGILWGYALPIRGVHGVTHWARVMENGLRLADAVGADREVVTLFALFHDACRVNEYEDEAHGLRGAELARAWRGDLVHLEDDRFELLFEACRRHTEGLVVADPTLQACWDADRLDLGRVGNTPLPHRLGSQAAREAIAWAHPRAVRDHVPAQVLAEWGVDL